MSSADGSNSSALAHPPARALRWNALLTAALLVAIAVLGSSLAERHLTRRIDLSEDGLYAIAPATRRIVERIEDRVVVRLFATEEVADGQYALRTARVRAQLDELLALRPGSFELQVLDPSVSSEARKRAADARFRPRQGRGGGLGGGGSEEVWLSLELGYRGRTARIPEPMPWQFETQFASRLHGLLSDRRIGVGWFGAPLDPPPEAGDDPQSRIAATFSRFSYVRSRLAEDRRDIEVRGLAEGRPVPEEVDVLFVVRPGAVHPRAAYEIEQFVQRGGRLVVCLDDHDYSVLTGAERPGVEGLEGFEQSALHRALKSWGAEVSRQQVWDKAWRTRRLQFNGGRWALVNDPMVITVREEGLSDEVPPTQSLREVQFWWAHPLATEGMVPTPPGVTRTDLVTTSETSWLNQRVFQLPRSAMDVTRQLANLQRRTDPGRFTLAAAFSGRFPSPWAGAEAPEAAESVVGAPPPAGAPRSAEVDTTVVVVGDSDWLRDPQDFGAPIPALFGEGGGRLFAENLVDWLSLDEELIGLRSRVPTPRPLRDFVGEEEAKLGVFEADPYETEAERAERAKKADRARGRARRRQWLTMLYPALGALLIVGLFGALWNGLQRREGRPSDRGGDA